MDVSVWRLRTKRVFVDGHAFGDKHPLLLKCKWEAASATRVINLSESVIYKVYCIYKYCKFVCVYE